MMRFGNVLYDGKPRLVVSEGTSLYLTHLSDEAQLESTDALLYGERDLLALRREEVSPENVRFLPAVTHPEKVICVGRNYLAHIEQEHAEVPAAPCLFAKFPSSLTSHGAVVRPPRGVRQLDYEAELAVVIGKEARSIPEERALDYVFGYSIANDVSARDLQFLTPQWLSGKAPDDFCPLGPWLVTADEIPAPQRLYIRAWRNGQMVQDSNTARMIFPVSQLLAYISNLITLRPGDVILTGTPEGVEYGNEEPNWLKAGELVEVEVEGLGRLSNTIGEER